MPQQQIEDYLLLLKTEFGFLRLSPLLLVMLRNILFLTIFVSVNIPFVPYIASSFRDVS